MLGPFPCLLGGHKGQVTLVPLVSTSSYFSNSLHCSWTSWFFSGASEPRVFIISWNSSMDGQEGGGTSFHTGPLFQHCILFQGMQSSQ